MTVSLRIHVDGMHHRAPWADDEHTAFDLMYRRCHDDLVCLCRRMLGQSGDAEATAHDAFVRAWLARDRYSPAKPFWPWLAMIARRLCLDHHRRMRRESVEGAHRRPVATIDGPEVAIDAIEDLRMVVEAIGQLRESERRALVFRELDGWTYEEIAAHEGVSVESVRGSLKRGRAALRRRLRVMDLTVAETPLPAPAPCLQSPSAVIYYDKREDSA